MIETNRLAGWAVGAAVVACLVFLGVGIHELTYASDHPHAYGPAKVIAWGSGGGALLSVAVGLIAVALLRRDSSH